MSASIDEVPLLPVQYGLDRVQAVDRRLRRMISNRESARRSRMRKQRHLEELRGQARRFKLENEDLACRLGAVVHYCALFRRENQSLHAESAALHRRLYNAHRMRLLQQLVSPPPACGVLNELNVSSSVIV